MKVTIGCLLFVWPSTGSSIILGSHTVLDWAPGVGKHSKLQTTWLTCCAAAMNRTKSIPLFAIVLYSPRKLLSTFSCPKYAKHAANPQVKSAMTVLEMLGLPSHLNQLRRIFHLIIVACLRARVQCRERTCDGVTGHQNTKPSQSPSLACSTNMIVGHFKKGSKRCQESTAYDLKNTDVRAPWDPKSRTRSKARPDTTKGDATTGSTQHAKTCQSKGERQDMSQPSPALSNPFWSFPGSSFGSKNWVAPMFRLKIRRSI